jgi:ATP/ADP translocase
MSLSNADPEPRLLGAQLLRTVGLFQAIVALPICIFLGGSAFFGVIAPYYYFQFYYFM